MSSDGNMSLPESPQNVAVEAQHLNKAYRAYKTPSARLAQLLLEPLARLFRISQPSFYEDFYALRDISLSVRVGETIGILGSNGAGKSTLLQVICKTLSPSSGHCKVKGRVAALLELGSGFNPDFTGRENVFMNAMILGLTQSEIEERYDSIMEFAGIGDFINKPVKTYSSGMTVRLAFAVIAHVDADILIVDEALSVGDAFFVQKCMRFVRKFMEHGTVLFVSHDTGAILNLCDRVIWIEHGSIKEQGQPENIVPRYLAMQHQGEETSFVESQEAKNELAADDIWAKDMRDQFINASNLRHDIEIIDCFVDSESFGLRGAEIEQVTFCDHSGHPLSWVVGGEIVSFEIICRINTDVTDLIVGFSLKDRLGQVVFGDNTFIACMDQKTDFSAGSRVRGSFEFRMPRLQVGSYTVDAAVAQGSQEQHIQHHWVYDAVALDVKQSAICHGQIAIPMRSISINLAST